MSRQDILNRVSEKMGLVPGWVNQMSDAQLEWFWPMQEWFQSDSKLSARDKALAALGAASAMHCHY
jgi:alkylhydroperoxidase/carboxymuconolactone decarboxylase family protein YurZ